MLVFRLKHKNPTDEVEAHRLITDAAQKAQAILSQAEMESLKVAENARLGEANFENQYSKKLDASLQVSLKEFKDFLANLEKQSQTTYQESQETVKAKINEALFKFEQNLTNYLSQAEQKSFQAVSLEISSARSLIDTYKTQQLQLVDENVVAVLERTLSLVLRNKLTLKDQMDLVFEALEKAKVEKFFA